MAATKTKRRTSRSRLNGPLPEAADTTQVLTLTEAAVFLRVSEAALLRSATLQEVPGAQDRQRMAVLDDGVQHWLGAAAPRRGLLSQIGALRDDPHREEMLREIYAQSGRPETEGR